MNKQNNLFFENYFQNYVFLDLGDDEFEIADSMQVSSRNKDRSKRVGMISHPRTLSIST